MTEYFKKSDDETLEEYYIRMFHLKEECGMNWQEITDIINAQTGQNHNESTYRKTSYKYKNKPDTFYHVEEETVPELDEVRLATVRLRDERSQINALYRRISREDSVKDIGFEAAKIVAKNGIKLDTFPAIKAPSDKAAILQIGDWHYGIETETIWNKYNTEIAKKRIAQLCDEVIKRVKQNDVKSLYVINLGDLISGRIHTQLRINSRIDVITQIMEVTELLSQFLTNLSEFVRIEYYDTMDNHSRVEPLKENSLELESLCRITTWYLKERLKDNKNVVINTNELADDIATFNVLGHNIIAVHGDKDKPGKVVSNLTLMTKQHYDMVLTAHLHHFAAEEQNDTLHLSTGSLMGTDDYAQNLRLNSMPSQNLVIVTPKNVCDTLYKIVLD